MKTYEVQVDGFVTEVEALSHIDALHKYVAEAEEILVDTEIAVAELTVDYNAPTSLDDEYIFYVTPKRIDYVATRVKEHLPHLDGLKSKVVEVLGDSIPCANCEVKPTKDCMYCHGHGVITPESVDAAEEYKASLREYRSTHV
jgi:hypothetical protein